MSNACGGELFGIAAVLDESAFEGRDLLVEQVVGLVDQADDGIGTDDGVIVFEPWGVKVPALLV